MEKLLMQYLKNNCKKIWCMSEEEFDTYAAQLEKTHEDESTLIFDSNVEGDFEQITIEFDGHKTYHIDIICYDEEGDYPIHSGEIVI